MSFFEFFDELSVMIDILLNFVVLMVFMLEVFDMVEGLLIVSLIVLIEVIVCGILVIVFDIFGVIDWFINLVFEGSGFFGDEGVVV